LSISFVEQNKPKKLDQPDPRHAPEAGDSDVLSATLSGGKGEEVGFDGLNTQAAHDSQCDAEEWHTVAGD